MFVIPNCKAIAMNIVWNCPTILGRKCHLQTTVDGVKAQFVKAKALG